MVYSSTGCLGQNVMHYFHCFVVQYLECWPTLFEPNVRCTTHGAFLAEVR